MIAQDGVGRALDDPLTGIHHEDVVAQGAKRIANISTLRRRAVASSVEGG